MERIVCLLFSEGRKGGTIPERVLQELKPSFSRQWGIPGSRGSRIRLNKIEEPWKSQESLPLRTDEDELMDDRCDRVEWSINSRRGPYKRT
jgi:hypothetical protein